MTALMVQHVSRSQRPHATTIAAYHPRRARVLDRRRSVVVFALASLGQLACAHPIAYAPPNPPEDWSKDLLSYGVYIKTVRSAEIVAREKAKVSTPLAVPKVREQFSAPRTVAFSRPPACAPSVAKAGGEATPWCTSLLNELKQRVTELGYTVIEHDKLDDADPSTVRDLRDLSLLADVDVLFTIDAFDVQNREVIIHHEQTHLYFYEKNLSPEWKTLKFTTTEQTASVASRCLSLFDASADAAPASELWIPASAELSITALSVRNGETLWQHHAEVEADLSAVPVRLRFAAYEARARDFRDYTGYPDPQVTTSCEEYIEYLDAKYPGTDSPRSRPRDLCAARGCEYGSSCGDFYNSPTPDLDGLMDGIDLHANARIYGLWAIVPLVTPFFVPFAIGFGAGGNTKIKKWNEKTSHQTHEMSIAPAENPRPEQILCQPRYEKRRAPREDELLPYIEKAGLGMIPRLADGFASQMREPQ